MERSSSVSSPTTPSCHLSVRLRGLGTLVEDTLPPSCHLSVRLRGHLALYTGHRAVQQSCCCDQCQCGLWEQRCRHLSWHLHPIGHLSSAAPAPTAATPAPTPATPTSPVSPTAPVPGPASGSVWSSSTSSPSPTTTALPQPAGQAWSSQHLLLYRGHPRF